MTPIVYNLFPRLVGSVDRWPEHAARAAEMGFDWLYLNPWHYPGFSGSLYAPKDFRRLNPLFAPPGSDGHDLEPLRNALARIASAGTRPMMDLVVNHTSKDALLTVEHPEWFPRDQSGALISPSVTDPDDPSKVTVWGDLAEVDNASAPNREALWEYWADLVRDSIQLGFQGFRCDAAYKVPSSLWRHLIEVARGIDPGIRFFAETLGASLEEVLSVRDAGFDFIFNSSKWWNFSDPWAIQQHEELRDVAPSISFPESHDTARLAEESGGSEAVQRQRYAFAAAFSAGIMMPVGYEYGFRKQVNVVHTTPSDWEAPSFDITSFVSRVNRLKLREPALQGEGALSTPWGLDGDVLLLERRPSPDDTAGRAWILVNKSTSAGFDVQLPPDRRPGDRLLRVCRDDAPADGEPLPERVRLDPAEVVYVLPNHPRPHTTAPAPEWEQSVT
jgi:starch synthase (maltosyl-transferring)